MIREERIGKIKKMFCYECNRNTNHTRWDFTILEKNKTFTYHRCNVCRNKDNNGFRKDKSVFTSQ